jgi:hypothetical protein
MTAPQIPQCNNKILGAFWHFLSFTCAIRHANPSAMRHVPQAQLSFILIPQFAGNFFF